MPWSFPALVCASKAQLCEFAPQISQGLPQPSRALQQLANRALRAGENGDVRPRWPGRRIRAGRCGVGVPSVPGRPPGKAADMWSLGVLLLEVACGLRSVERALPPLSAAPAGRKGGPMRHAPPPATVAQELQAMFRRPQFLSGLLARAMPEAAALQPWLDSAVRGLLEASASHLSLPLLVSLSRFLGNLFLL